MHFRLHKLTKCKKTTWNVYKMVAQRLVSTGEMLSVICINKITITITILSMVI